VVPHQNKQEACHTPPYEDYWLPLVPEKVSLLPLISIHGKLRKLGLVFITPDNSSFSELENSDHDHEETKWQYRAKPKAESSAGHLKGCLKLDIIEVD
jgi:hypothetical protein